MLSRKPKTTLTRSKPMTISENIRDLINEDICAKCEHVTIGLQQPYENDSINWHGDCKCKFGFPFDGVFMNVIVHCNKFEKAFCK